MKQADSKDNTPKYLYRFFDKKEHRDQFIQGLIRFGRLEVYKEIEDEKRKDIDEGEPRGKYQTDRQMFIKISNETGKVVERGFKPGIIDISGYSPNIFFIISLTDKSSDLKSLSEKFGNYVVKINNVEKLLDLLNQNCKIPWKVGKIILEQVKYDKYKHITMEKDNPHLPFGYYFAQKPETFADEKEWRIVLTGSAIEEIDDNNKEYITLEIGSIEDITTITDL